MPKYSAAFTVALVLAIAAGPAATQNQERRGVIFGVMLEDGRENPAVNRFGLRPEVLARPRVTCSIAGDPGLRGAANDRLWPDGRVPYAFAANVTGAQQSVALSAMTAISDTAAIEFVPLTTESDAIVFQSSTGNSSFVGQIGGFQTINIFNWNFQFIVVHEIMHAVGLYHEHQRPDRNLFIDVNFDNLSPPTCSDCSASCQSANFGIPGDADAIGLYDYDSVMHYGPTGFGCGNTVISIRQSRPSGAFFDDPAIPMGQRTQISEGDGLTLRALYGPEASFFVRFGWTGSTNGTFSEPFSTLPQALAAVPSGETIVILGGGSTPETPVIDRPVRIDALGGSALIGD